MYNTDFANSHCQFPMQLKSRPDILLLGFITFSLLLHLLLLLLLPRHDLFPVPTRQAPVYVEMRPPQPPPAPPRERELDLPIRPELEKPRETPAKRLGPADQVVKKETAPKGESPEDMRPEAPVPPKPSSRPAQTAVPKSVPRPASPAPSVRERPAETAPRQQSKTASQRPAEAPPTETVPDLKSLLELPQTTVARLDKEWRQKYRADVEKGDAYFLDTEKDILISFFQRFRNNIYGVWSYPAGAVTRGEEGTCLLKVTVNRDGTLGEMKLLESSGFQDLDEAAMEAVRKAAPYGSLPRTYHGEKIIIFPFFNYSLVQRLIY